MAIKPLYDRVLVQRIESENKTASGLYIPDSAKRNPSKGDRPCRWQGQAQRRGSVWFRCRFTKGTRSFGKYSGTEVSIDGTDHLILREEEILAVITE
ncbi:MAG: co-chaperone GroES [bacterium]